ncbi:hypothetical protein A4A49_35849 [Nicotiana attenuata]|uniref:Uncharacterized protein n=1 Tax=Nicotiana attenuata TaxID=49451 RepID=A0A1J6K7L3_NICAT|nr:hypothetical protein A4A49_35849 [Nicotiana attenuata]
MFRVLQSILQIQALCINLILDECITPTQIMDCRQEIFLGKMMHVLLCRHSSASRSSIRAANAVNKGQLEAGRLDNQVGFFD